MGTLWFENTMWNNCKTCFDVVSIMMPEMFKLSLIFCWQFSCNHAFCDNLVCASWPQWLLVLRSNNVNMRTQSVQTLLLLLRYFTHLSLWADFDLKNCCMEMSFSGICVMDNYAGSFWIRCLTFVDMDRVHWQKQSNVLFTSKIVWQHNATLFDVEKDVASWAMMKTT